MRLYAIPFSTNVERVALALGHKGVDAELVMVDPRDRTRVREASGQELVPVLEDGDAVVIDSSRILEHLERRFPQPSLFPAEPSRRAEVRLFVSWFDRVWKHAPNAIEAQLRGSPPDAAEIDRLDGEMAASTAIVEELLQGRPYLAGDELTAADCAAFPFLRYCRGVHPADDELFHRVLAHRLSPERRWPAIAGWVERVDRRARLPMGYSGISSS